MRDIQPSFTTDQGLAGYRSGLATFNEIVAEREAALFASRDDPARLEDAQQELYRVRDPRLKHGGLCLDSTAIRHSVAAAPLWLHRPTHQAAPTRHPCSPSLAGRAAF